MRKSIAAAQNFGAKCKFCFESSKHKLTTYLHILQVLKIYPIHVMLMELFVTGILIDLPAFHYTMPIVTVKMSINISLHCTKPARTDASRRLKFTSSSSKVKKQHRNVLLHIYEVHNCSRTYNLEHTPF